jgi:hypothetical protein
MIYIFEILNTGFIKLGFTSKTNVWFRVQGGFWTNKHPSETCNMLGPDHLQLKHVFKGGLYFETMMKKLFPPNVGDGEFYKTDPYLNILMTMLECMTTRYQPVEKPSPNFFLTVVEKLPCCGGLFYTCDICAKVFNREHKLYEHKREVHAKRNRVVCVCGKTIVKRNLKRHKADNCNA